MCFLPGLRRPRQLLLLLCLFIPSGRPDDVTITHAVKSEAVLVSTKTSKVHEVFFDMKPTLDGLATLVTHLKPLRDHLQKDMEHLRTTAMNTFVADGVFYTFALQSTKTPSSTSLCPYLGVDTLNFTKLEEFRNISNAIVKFNKENEGTTFPQIDKFIVPLKIKAGTADVIYEGSDTKLDITFTAVQLVLIRDRSFPVFSITKDDFVYQRDENEAPTVAPELCYYDPSSGMYDKLRHLGLWRSFVQQRHARVNRLLTRIIDMRNTLQTSLGSHAAFSYQSGTVHVYLQPESMSDLDAYRNELPHLHAKNIISEASFAMASLHMEAYVTLLNDHFDAITDACLCSPVSLLYLTVTDRAVELVTSTVKQALSTSIHTDALVAAMEQSVAADLWMYDANLQRLSLAVTYYQPADTDILLLLHVITFPVRSQHLEVELMLPQDHLLCTTDLNTCQFIDHSTIAEHCDNLGKPSIGYVCPTIHFPSQEVCPSHLAQVDYAASIDTCGVQLYKKPSALHILHHEIYNYVLVSSLTETVAVQVQCSSGNTDHDVMETSMISTACDIQHGATVFPAQNSTLTGFAIRPISDLFPGPYSELVKQALNITAGPNGTSIFLPPVVKTSWEKFMASTYVQYIMLPLTGALAVILCGAATICFLLHGRKRHRRRQRTRAHAPMPYVSAIHIDPASLPLCTFTQPRRAPANPGNIITI